LLSYSGAEVTDDADAGVVWVRFTHRTPALSFAKCVRWEDDHVEERLSGLAERMRAAGEWPQISIAEGVSRPATLAAVLEQQGWVKVDGERMMFTRHAPVVPHLDPGLRIEAVTPRTAPDLVRLEIANFDLPPTELDGRVERLGAAVVSGALRGFIVRLFDEPLAGTRVATGVGLSGARVAGLSGVGVAAGHRGRGYGRLLAAVATRAGLATGHGLVWLSVDESNTPALKLYKSLGYEPTFEWSRWLAPAV
jgi:ribosomal protein S18 acetylase RimI-like enzyme